MKSLKTEIIIETPADKIWSILVDFESYSEWNPFIKSFEGKIAKGEKFKVTLQLPNSKPMTFHPKCLVLEKNKEFRWLGHLLINGLFDGEHIFELEDLGNGQTKFIQRENFRGVLVPLLWKKINSSTRSGFIEMNKQLKIRAEQTKVQ
ncbi:MAG: SRPBCC domain-containing protein [Balneolales bacterium]